MNNEEITNFKEGLEVLFNGNKGIVTGFSKDIQVVQVYFDKDVSKEILGYKPDPFVRTYNFGIGCRYHYSNLTFVKNL